MCSSRGENEESPGSVSIMPRRTAVLPNRSRSRSTVNSSASSRSAVGDSGKSLICALSCDTRLVARTPSVR